MATTERLAGVTKGIVIDIDDPAGYNRIKIRIPEIHGIMNPDNYGTLLHDTAKNAWVSDDKLPYAEVCYPFGNDTMPEINQIVWVAFFNGDVDSPIILGWAGYEYTSKEEQYKIPNM